MCRPLYVLGYIPKDNRVYLGDKELGVVSYSVQLSVLEYQTAIMRKDFDTADKVRPVWGRWQVQCVYVCVCVTERVWALLLQRIQLGS